MSMIINHELPIPEKLKSQFPLSQRIQEIKKKEMPKSEISSQESQTNFLFLWVLVLRIMKNLSVNM